ncbi:AAA family ATPase [Trinickia fusca]|uniref:RecBCD enzyme subunit RecD n=1 Tax=Trinickia fusca TaxID=2419777 RepID=A0A494XX64_9BURK|nr:AAA family ATPase [Trinickia fusca]RKP52173.1 DUF2075 domain-containing protein [Trinickia fusca]
MSASPTSASFGAGEFGTALAEGFARRVGELAERLGADAASVRWVRRAAYAASRATSVGHVCVSLPGLARRYGEAYDEACAALRASGVVSDQSVASDALRPLVVDAQGRLYLARYFDYERALANAIVAHAAAGSAPHAGVHRTGGDDAPLGTRLARYFGPPSTDDIDWQRAAAALALSGRLTIVSGGPGTGKTTTVVGMLACLLDANPQLSIALAAPTGKAAQRMQEALLARATTLPEAIAERLPRTSQTLHRLLGAGHGTRVRHHRDNPLPYDVLVVDEASMIDVAMAAQLFDALAPETRLVLLGDKDQLAAVEAGAVFAELSAQPAFSAAGLACIASATGFDEARIAAALPNADTGAGANACDARQSSMTTEADVEVFDDDTLLPEFSDWGAQSLSERPVAPVAPLAPSVARASASEVPSPGEPLAEPRKRAAQTMHTVPAERGARAWHQATLFAEEPAPERSPLPGSVAAPLVDSVIWLERNYRFGLDSPIGRLSLAIRRGDADAALDTLGHAGDEGAVAVLDEDGGQTLATRTVERLAQGFSHYAAALAAALAQREPDPTPLFDALNVYRILCATRVGTRGVDALNALMAAHVRREAGVPLAVGATWFAGRPVMIARNDYALGLFNGDIGIALPGADGALRVYLRTADGGLRAVTPAALPPHDTAFALTVHKSQGSEFDHAALVLPASASRVLSRELVYTAVTRARVAVRIVGARRVLAQAIATPTRRDSGLVARMMQASSA